MFIAKIKRLLGSFHDAEDYLTPRLVNSRQQRVVRAIEEECINVEAPLQRIENKLHPFTAFVIMPVFAFANAGVHIDWSHFTEMLVQPVTIGVALGLILGKQVGVMLFSFVTVKLKLAELPTGVSWKQLYGLSWLAGIGFTMSLFIAKLAYGGGHGGDHGGGHGEVVAHGAEHLAEAKIGIIIASLLAGLIGGAILYLTSSPQPEKKGHGGH
jgi:NhaA family Na+:H+ antiporter